MCLRLLWREHNFPDSYTEAGPPDGISVSLLTFDPFNVDQYLISLVSFVFVLNNPHSQKKTSDALADPHSSKVIAPVDAYG